jgi:hypothetical protein
MRPARAGSLTSSSSAGYGSAIQLRPYDFLQYSLIAYRLSAKSGYLLKQGTVNKYSMKKRLFALFGNLSVNFFLLSPLCSSLLLFASVSTFLCLSLSPDRFLTFLSPSFSDYIIMKMKICPLTPIASVSSLQKAVPLRLLPPPLPVSPSAHRSLTTPSPLISLSSRPSLATNIIYMPPQPLIVSLGLKRYRHRRSSLSSPQSFHQR